MKGIILAGGNGTRLWPITKAVSKQLIPIYDKPMIYYPMSTMMLALIKEVLIITNPEYIDSFKNLFGDGSQLGMRISYASQAVPRGLADAFLIAESCGFATNNDDLCLILGDNIFHGSEFRKALRKAEQETLKENATVFGYKVNDPERYGVAEFDEKGNCISIEEKPENPKSNYAVTGLYFYPAGVIDKAKRVTPSKRGELEITTLNQMYLNSGHLKVQTLDLGFAWLDTGTFDSLNDASNYVRIIQERQGVKIANLEYIAKKNKWI